MSSKVYPALRVPVDPPRAFAAFTGEIASWWRPDPLFRITPEGDGKLEFEPGADGRLITRSSSVEANKRDMPYQSLIKVWLAEVVNRSRA